MSDQNIIQIVLEQVEVNELQIRSSRIRETCAASSCNLLQAGEVKVQSNVCRLIWIFFKYSPVLNIFCHWGQKLVQLSAFSKEAHGYQNL